ncbi:MAG: hypothetical protein RLZ10_1159 [Bacteroidota bacterium]|jgi:pyruvate dehydrogenase E1 component alpha subunit
MDETQDLLAALADILKIRTAENLIANDFLTNKIFSFLHLSIGQEAAAVGVCRALKDTDYVLGNHRSHGHYLARGGDLKRMFFEIYGHQSGCCGGLGGSMHMLDRSVGFVGSTPILGSVTPIGSGFAMKQVHSGNKDGVSVSFIGDGAAEEGSFYETLNLAARFKLPYLVVIEDNRYAVNSTHADRKSPSYNYEKIVTGLGCFYIRANGQQYLDVLNATKVARKSAINGTPAVIHLDVLRDFAHSGPIRDDAATYRKDDTKQYREENDPLKNLEKILLEDFGVSNAAIEKLLKDTIHLVNSQYNEVRSIVKEEVGF